MAMSSVPDTMRSIILKVQEIESIIETLTSLQTFGDDEQFKAQRDLNYLEETKFCLEAEWFRLSLLQTTP